MKTDRQQLLRVLVAAACADAGVDDPQLVRELACALTPLVYRAALRDVAERVAMLGNTPGAHAIERLLYPDSESIRDHARRVGIAPSALWRAEKALRALLLKQSKKSSAMVARDECKS